MADMMKKVPVREQEPKVRATNFEEVCLGYNKEEAMEEATRCLNCKNARCIQGCPVSINIPAFIQEVKAGNIEEAYKVIGKSSAFRLSVDVSAHRSPSVRENVSVVLKVKQFLSESLRDLLRITLWSMILSRSVQRQRMVIKLQSSVPVRPDLPVQEIWQS